MVTITFTQLAAFLSHVLEHTLILRDATLLYAFKLIVKRQSHCDNLRRARSAVYGPGKKTVKEGETSAVSDMGA